MIRSGWRAAAAAFVAIGLLYAWLEAPPLRTRVVPIPAEFLAWLRGDHAPDLSERLRDPLEVSLRLRTFGGSDPIDTRGMRIKVDRLDSGECRVSIDARHIEDDSIDRVYTVVRLEREGLLWVPVEHRCAIQGRGVFGWTKGPTN